MYELGDLVRVQGTFTNSAGTNIDPSVVRAQYKNPIGTITTLVYGTDVELVRSALGIFYVDIDANLSGRWHYRIHSTGTGQGAAEGEFVVKESQFG